MKLVSHRIKKKEIQTVQDIVHSQDFAVVVVFFVVVFLLLFFLFREII